MKQTDCLAFGPHPDDIELFCGGLLVKIKKQGYTTGVVDLTRGELSTNGSVETRQAEADEASRILGLDLRQNLGLADGYLESTPTNRRSVIEVIRSLRPQICLIPYWEDRHPDHQAAARLLERAIFDAGLIKIKTGEEAYRPEIILYYMLHQFFTPSFIVDISEEMEYKMAAIRAYVSQFSECSKEAQSTYINNVNFLDTIQTRAEFFGQQIRSKFGEGFYYKGMLKINNILQFFS